MSSWRRISLKKSLIAITLLVVLGVMSLRYAEDYVVVNRPIVWHSIDTNLVTDIKRSKHVWIVNEFYSTETKRISLRWHLEKSTHVRAFKRFAARNNLKFVDFDISEESEAATDFVGLLQECTGYSELRGGIYLLDPLSRRVFEIGSETVACEEIIRVVEEFKKDP